VEFTFSINTSLIPHSDGLISLRNKNNIGIFLSGVPIEHRINANGILEFCGKKDVVYEIIPENIQHDIGLKVGKNI